MINGKSYDWEAVTIKLPHGTLYDVESIEYEDSSPVRRVYGKGRRPRGYSQGNEEASGKLVMRREEFNRLVADAGEAGHKGIAPFEITASYANQDQPTTTDTLRSCKFVTTKTGASQDDESIEVELDFVILDGINWGGFDSFQEGE
jgi:hypothetical protein